MEVKAHFLNIHKVIINHLEQAQAEIVAAIAWFTDRDIFEVLCSKARLGINVSVALIGDTINRGPGGLNFERLVALGGRVIYLPPGSRDEPIMHHKFCVIDRDTVITGSYNWSHKARSNDENITVVIDSADFAAKYLDTFDGLLARGLHGIRIVADVDAARRRLETIRNLLLLGEQDDIASHVGKLRPVAEALHLARIIAALDDGEFKTALDEIDTYLRNATALVAEGHADIPCLRLQLESLELRLESLSDEKAEIERRLITFNRRHDEALGGMIQQILKAKAELARLIVIEDRIDDERIKAEAAARDAEETFQFYSRRHEELLRSKPLPKLDEEGERELQALYRRACSLSHPDKVTEDRKDAAHRVFVELQEAYKWNDLSRVRKIYETLKLGDLPLTRSGSLTAAEVLRVAITELEYAIARLISELKILQESEGVRLMSVAGATETDWQLYFQRQHQTLKRELARIESSILTVQSRGR